MFFEVRCAIQPFSKLRIFKQSKEIHLAVRVSEIAVNNLRHFCVIFEYICEHEEKVW